MPTNNNGGNNGNNGNFNNGNNGNNGNNFNNGNFNGNFNSGNNFNNGRNNNNQSSQISSQILKSLKDINKNILGLYDFAQGEAKSEKNEYSYNKRRNARRKSTSRYSGFYDDEEDQFKNAPRTFEEGVDKALSEFFKFPALKEGMRKDAEKFASALGTNLDHLSGTLGENLTKIGIDWAKTIPSSIRGFEEKIKSSKIGQMGQSVKTSVQNSKVANTTRNITQKAENKASDLSQRIKSSDFVNRAKSTRVGSKIAERAEERRQRETERPKMSFDFSNPNTLLENAREQFKANYKIGEQNYLKNHALDITTPLTGSQKASQAMTGFLTATRGAIGPLAKATAALAIFDAATGDATERIKEVASAWSKLKDAASNAARRDQETAEKNQQLANERFRKDVESIISEPFEILKEAAQTVQKAWDANLKTITATQGYDKAGLQDLMSEFAQRLRDENLTSVVSGADIIDNLSKVLNAGLSGEVAEEFAYQATILNQAIPTQDFFGYAETYASLAANAIQAGKSQEEAISYANEQLKTFASDVLFASRQLSGGFSTGLKNAESLFTDAVQIANTARQGNPADIAGVLTSVSATVGAIAPDLANGIVQSITQAAMGGNNSQYVALRSLAGINASNTEFVQAFAENPKEIFEEIFRNLANMQNMAPGAYMEVAEGLSSVFNVSMDAFARVDFGKLADAVQNMQVNQNSLEENMNLLERGETTTTAEQLRMQQINQYMIDEGLSYVLDNEVARSIQEHMWDEQMQRELQQSTFAVELKGEALEFLTKIGNAIESIIGILNPISWINKTFSLVETTNEANQLNADIESVLKLGQVGKSNWRNNLEYQQLITRDKDLQLTSDYVTLLGGKPEYQSGKSGFSRFVGAFGGGYSQWQANKKLDTDDYQSSFAYEGGGIPSEYSWAGRTHRSGSYGKSAYNSIQGSRFNNTQFSALPMTSESRENAALNTLRNSFNKMIDAIPEMTSRIDENGNIKNAKDIKSYEDWKNSARQYGISDFDKTIEQLGYKESDLQNYFLQNETQAAAVQKVKEEEDERKWKEDMLNYSTNISHNTVLDGEDGLTVAQLTSAGNDILTNIQNSVMDGKTTVLTVLTDFYNSWIDYYINKTDYRNNFSAGAVGKLEELKAGESDKAIYSLADILTSKATDLLDPTMQTNVLLAEILTVAQAIMQQNNTKGQLSIADSLSAMATGMFKTSK